MFYRDYIEEYIPADHSHQISATHYIGQLLKNKTGPIRVMDLGCGEGNSIDIFKKNNPEIKWVGLDIESSPEVKSRIRTDAEFHTFDGMHIPFDSDHFDLIYCDQVIEHVKHPNELLKEVARALKPGGHFFGSVAALELYHSRSIANYTPYGLSLLVKDSGLQLIELRPGIDSFSMLSISIMRNFLKINWLYNACTNRESPLNIVISYVERLRGKSSKETNGLKLYLCGHFCFLAQKPSE